MIIEGKITSINRYTTKKDGSPLLSSKGVPYTSVRIKTDVTNDDILSGFENSDTKAWVVGSDIEIDVERKGDFVNFKTLKKGAGVDNQLLKDIYDNTETILNKMVAQQIRQERILELLEPKKKGNDDTSDYPQDIDPDLIPF